MRYCKTRLQQIKENPKDLRITLALFLIATTVAVYWPVGTHQFLNYDDQLFVYTNPHVYTGVSLSNLKWAFTTLHGDASYWHPLTWLSLQLDCQLFGLRPGALHLTNLLLHTINTVLIFVLFSTISQTPWRSAAVALLFAIHPLHIETVAWISERKTLLCTLFWFLSLIAYSKYVLEPTIIKYFVVLGLFVASLMSKPIAVALPLSLLIMDFWPLARIKYWNSKNVEGKQCVIDGNPKSFACALLTT
jgi:protein O-mannosyl-transferase